MGPTFAAALSEHPLATQAVGEVVGQVLESLGTPPDVAMLFVTGPHAGALEDIARAVRRLVNPRVLVGATAVSVLGGSQEVEETPGIVLWAARFDVDVEPVRLEAIPTADNLFVAGGGVLNRNDGTLLLVADPFSFPVEQVLGHLRDSAPDVAIVGGMASAARGPGGNVLVLDDELFRSGAVGVWLPPTVPITTVVSQGCRPIGQPFVVTKAERNVIYELAGQEALSRLNETIDSLSDHDKRLLANGLHIGHVIDEQRIDYGRGDFLIRGVLGADRKIGAIAIGDEVPVGATVQFQVRDAESADEDLHALIDGQRARGVLVFTCNGRGSNLFGTPGHDAEVVSEQTGGAVAGMFCAGEFGPVGSVNFVHGFTASIALFGAQR
jgi:small ligand-binding sensory domain FIST